MMIEEHLMATYPPFSTPNWDAPLKAYLDGSYGTLVAKQPIKV